MALAAARYRAANRLTDYCAVPSLEACPWLLAIAATVDSVQAALYADGLGLKKRRRKARSQGKASAR